LRCCHLASHILRYGELVGMLMKTPCHSQLHPPCSQEMRTGGRWLLGATCNSAPQPSSAGVGVLPQLERSHAGGAAGVICAGLQAEGGGGGRAICRAVRSHTGSCGWQEGQQAHTHADKRAWSRLIGSHFPHEQNSPQCVVTVNELLLVNHRSIHARESERARISQASSRELSRGDVTLHSFAALVATPPRKPLLYRSQVNTGYQ
jgi:hypothetical protein